MRLNSSKYHSIKKQQGSTLVVAIFVIVVLGALVAGLSSLVRTTSESVVVEVLGARSFMAAQSGLERGMVKLYSPNQNPVEICRSSALGSESGNVLDLDTNCKATVTCREPYEYELASKEVEVHLRLESVGSCAGGGEETSRELAIETRVRVEN